jgi:CubicO group peptidase (beta-lactamase class C family)
MTRYVLLLAFVFSGFSLHAQAPFDTATALRNNPGIFSLVVTMDDSTVYSRYFNGKGPTELFNNQSLTKSIEAVLIGIAIDKGFIPSLYTGIANYFPLLKNDPDKRKTIITIADVMNQAQDISLEVVVGLFQLYVE